MFKNSTKSLKGPQLGERTSNPTVADTDPVQPPLDRWAEAKADVESEVMVVGYGESLSPELLKLVGESIQCDLGRLDGSVSEAELYLDIEKFIEQAEGYSRFSNDLKVLSYNLNLKLEQYRERQRKLLRNLGFRVRLV